MTGRERVLAAINMQKVDRQPCDFHSCAVIEERLHKYLGTKTHRELLEKLGTDMVDIRGVVDPVWVADFPMVRTREDGSTIDYLGFCKKVQNTVFGPVEEHCDYIVKDCDSIEEIDEIFTFPKVEWFDFSTMSERLKEYENFAIMASGPSVFQHPAMIRKLDQLLCDYLVDPEIAEYLMDGYTNYYVEYFDTLFKACPGQIDILRCADDFGMQERPMVSRDLVKTYIVPRVKKLADMAHSHGVKLLFHSCGSVFEFIDLFIEAGVDILDPLQPLAKDMEPEHLAEHYQGKICFHGSIDTQYVLPKGTTEEVRSQVRHHMEVLGGTGTGFILAPAHTVQPDVPVENIVALYEEVHR